MLKEIGRTPKLMGVMMLYVGSNSIFKSQNTVSIFFLEKSYESGGQQIDPRELSFLTLLCYFPSILIIMMGPKLTPRYVSYKVFFKGVLGLLILSAFFTPVLRDVLPLGHYRWLIYANQSVIYWISPKAFSPFCNYLIGK